MKPGGLLIILSVLFLQQYTCIAQKYRRRDIPSGNNLALGKPVHMSSVHPNTADNDISPNHAVDGHRYDKRKVAATVVSDSSIPEHWLVLQLQDMIKIKTIILIARNPVCCDYQLQGVTVSTSNESDYRKWQSSPRYDCVTIPHVSPPPPGYMYKVKCHQEASAVILHCPSDRALGLSEIEVYNQEEFLNYKVFSTASPPHDDIPFIPDPNIPSEMLSSPRYCSFICQHFECNEFEVTQTNETSQCQIRRYKTYIEVVGL